MDEENLAIGYRLAKDSGIDVEKQQEFAETYAQQVADRARMGTVTEPTAEEVNIEIIKAKEEPSSQVRGQEDQDVGSELVPISDASYQTRNYVKRFFKDDLHGADAEIKLNKISEEMDVEWKRLIDKTKISGLNVNPDTQMFDFIEGRYGKQLPIPAQQYWTALGNRKLKEKSVPMLTWQNGKLKHIEQPEEEGPGIFP